jgi:xylulokinase
LPDVAAPGTVLALVNECAAAGTGLAPGTPVVAGGGDGQAAGLGVNILKPERAYLNLGTAVVSGIHAPDYRIGQAWRTMSCCSGEGYIFETSLRSGTMLLDWFVTMCGAGQDGAEARRRLEEEAAGLATGSAGLLAVPYWGAVMTPYWDTAARGCFVGLTPAHRPAHLYRALMEGIAMEQAMVMGMIEQETGTRVREIVAIGGGAASDPWCRILANACGVPLKRSQTVEASSLGAAMCAAAGAGWFRSVAEAAEAMSGTLGRETAPDPHGQARLAELLAIYREVYPSLRDTHRRLARFVAAE